MHLFRYGEQTASTASTYYEVQEWKQTYEGIWGPIIPIRLIPFDHKFKFKTADECFTWAALQTSWDEGPEQVAKKIFDVVAKRVSRNAVLENDDGETISTDEMADLARAFLWQEVDAFTGDDASYAHNADAKASDVETEEDPQAPDMVRHQTLPTAEKSAFF